MNLLNHCCWLEKSHKNRWNNIISMRVHLFISHSRSAFFFLLSITLQQHLCSWSHCNALSTIEMLQSQIDIIVGIYRIKCHKYDWKKLWRLCMQITFDDKKKTMNNYESNGKRRSFNCDMVINIHSKYNDFRPFLVSAQIQWNFSHSMEIDFLMPISLQQHRGCHQMVY